MDRVFQVYFSEEEVRKGCDDLEQTVYQCTIEHCREDVNEMKTW